MINLTQFHIKTFRQKSFVTWFLIFVLIFFPGCVSSRNRNSDKANVDHQPLLNEEISVGQKIHQEILSNYYLYTKPDVISYVSEVGQSVAQSADRKLPYRFTVLYNEEVYATSAPGGFVYITTGMMNFLDNEAELAAVLAHEVGQLQFRNPAFSTLRKLVSGAAQTGTTVAPAFGQIGMLAMLGFVMIHAVANAGSKDFQDKIEDADDLALQYLVDAGYDPQGLLNVVEKFINADRVLAPLFANYYETRPITQDRLDHLENEFSKLPLGEGELLTRHKIYQDTTKSIREIYRT